MRKPFSDGLNSAAHVALGAQFQGSGLLPFLVYQFILKKDRNSGVDTAEYLAGWLAGNVLANRASATGQQPDRVLFR